MNGPGTNDIAYELLLIILLRSFGVVIFIFVSQNISLVVSSNSGLAVILIAIREIFLQKAPILGVLLDPEYASITMNQC